MCPRQVQIIHILHKIGIKIDVKFQVVCLIYHVKLTYQYQN